ncbi:MAG: hypothetical protein IPP15_16725 [Saprospiraceae bacterium]|uniref:Kelch repeat protein n=1 Tax=Candidatus Opimibacter skivensis TaxID=2982028 RepID=A0A9D7SVD4_9BACT|nr:hypothetical protein [Candidatus Opimibacter skivensis]
MALQNRDADLIVEEYDPSADKWTRLADLPAPNGFFGLITIDNKIYAIGGRLYHESSPIIKYDVIGRSMDTSRNNTRSTETDWA